MEYINQITKTIIQENNNDELTLIFNQYRTMVYCQIYRIVKNKEDALDLTHDCFIKYMIKKEEMKESIFNTGGLLRKIALNLALDFVRAKNRHRILEKIPFINIFNKRSYTNPRQKIANKELHIDLMNMIMHLSPSQQKIICLRYFEELRLNEIADILNCSIGTVKKNINRAYIKLRKLINNKELKDYLLPETEMENYHVSYTEAKCE